MSLFKKPVKVSIASLLATCTISMGLMMVPVFAATPAVPTPPPDVDPAIQCNSNNCDLIAKYINPAINLLSIAFGLIAVISLILGGIQFSTSEGDPQKASKAKNRIASTILAIFVYSLMYGFLQFLVPGGLFH